MSFQPGKKEPNVKIRPKRNHGNGSKRFNMLAAVNSAGLANLNAIERIVGKSIGLQNPKLPGNKAKLREATLEAIFKVKEIWPL